VVVDYRVIAVDVGHFPLVLLDMGHAGRSRDDFDQMFDAFRAANDMARKTGKPYVLVAVTRDVPNPGERKMIVERANTFTHDDHKLVGGVVLIIQNGIIRGAVTVLGWMIPRMGRFEAVSSTDEGVEAGVRLVRKLGLDYGAERVERAKQWFRRNEGGPRLRGVAGSR
jgi:hypothetical protein